MHEEFFDKLEELRKKNEPFVTAYSGTKRSAEFGQKWR
jgi:hypothetical protein